MNNSNSYADVGATYVVIGRDPEMADYDNPRGEIIRPAYFVTVTHADGSRLQHVRTFVARQRISPCPQEARAQQLADAVNRHLAAGKKLNPAHWQKIRAEYGSDAYIREGGEQDEIEAEREELAREGW